MRSTCGRTVPSLCERQPQNHETKRARHEAVEVELPHYDHRRRASARDPKAVMDAHWVNVRVRLARLLGIRMCYRCPHCNDGLPQQPHFHPCQDKFGSNMLPCGGVCGGVMALGGSNEHQGIGTPHLHADIHVVCAPISYVA